MSGVGGGGTASGFNADAAFALLNAVSDPEVHKQRIQELIEEQVKAGAATQELNKAHAQAAAAQADVNTKLDKLFKDQAALDAKAHDLDVSMKGREQAVTIRENGVSKRETDVAAGEAKLADEQSSWASQTAAKKSELDAREAAVKSTEQKVAADRDAVDALVAEYKSKIDKLKSIVL